jgi:glycosyltransferase involved in cell wall biosynthesis
MPGQAFDVIQEQVKAHMYQGERELAIIIPTYNNAQNHICLKNVSSVLDQEYENFHVHIIDDASTDGTAQILAEYLASHPRSDKVTLHVNERRVGAMANFYTWIHKLADHVIVLNIDGDDWLPHTYVFSYINNMYSNQNIWLTYGQYQEFPSGQIGFCQGYPKRVIKRNGYRKHGLPISHLRTYYAWLFKKIKKEDLMYEGTFVQATCDKVMMVPMIEMSGGRFMCTQDVLYIYNAMNPISDMRIRGLLQGKIRDRLFKMSPYKPLLEIITNFAVDA